MQEPRSLIRRCFGSSGFVSRLDLQPCLIATYFPFLDLLGKVEVSVLEHSSCPWSTFEHTAFLSVGFCPAVAAPRSVLWPRPVVGSLRPPPPS